MAMFGLARASGIVDGLNRGSREGAIENLDFVDEAVLCYFHANLTHSLRLCAQNSKRSLLVTIPSSISPFMTATADCPLLKRV